MPKEDFRREVEKELMGKEVELSELIYFKVYKSQIPVVGQPELYALAYLLLASVAKLIHQSWMLSVRPQI